MKKNAVLILCAIFIAVLSFSGIAAAQETNEVFIPGESKLYTPEEIAAGADIIAKKFSEYEGVELYRIEYGGDARSLYELEISKTLYEEPYDQCMVFVSAFRTSDDKSMTWAPNEDYFWSWTLFRANGGEWELKNWGWAEYFLDSKQFSIYDLMGAADNIFYEIQQMEGVKLLNISYTDDEVSASNLEYINSLDEGKYDECAVFEVWFMSPQEAYGAWEADTLYVWTWYLGRSDKGLWESVTFGVG